MGDSQDQGPRPQDARHGSADGPDASGVNETSPRAGAAPAGGPGQDRNLAPTLDESAEGLRSGRGGLASAGPPNDDGDAGTGYASSAPRTGSSARPVVALATSSPRARLEGLLREGPPLGPTRPGFGRSPLRGPWLTSVLGAVLLVGITLMFISTDVYLGRWLLITAALFGISALTLLIRMGRSRPTPESGVKRSGATRTEPDNGTPGHESAP